MSTVHLTNGDIAEIYEGLGDGDRAALYRYLDEPDPDALTVEELSDEVFAALDDVAQPGKTTKHDEDCWKKHTYCLAERVRGVFPE